MSTWFCDQLDVSFGDVLLGGQEVATSFAQLKKAKISQLSNESFVQKLRIMELTLCLRLKMTDLIVHIWNVPGEATSLLKRAADK